MTDKQNPPSDEPKETPHEKAQEELKEALSSSEGEKPTTSEASRTPSNAQGGETKEGETQEAETQASEPVEPAAEGASADDAAENEAANAPSDEPEDAVGETKRQDKLLTKEEKALLEQASKTDVIPSVRLSVRPVMFATFAIMTICFGGFCVWASLAPLASGAIAHGQIIAETERKAVQHLEGGIVEEILVREGDRVAEGDVIIRLKETQARLSRDLLQSRLDTAMAREAALRAEQAGDETITFPEVIAARIDDTDLSAIVAVQEDLFIQRRTMREGQLDILDQRIGQFKNQIEGMQAQVTASDRQIDLIEDELRGLKELQAKGHVSRTRILELERRAAELRGERGQFESEIRRINVGIGEAEIQRLQLINEFQERVVAEMSEVQEEILLLTDQIEAARDVLARTEIKSPQDGTVVSLNVKSRGEVIRSGDTIVEIVPANERLVIKALVSPQDVDQVHVGVPAEVRLTALKHRTMPPFEAAVLHVSADVLTDPQSGLGYYDARVMISDHELSRLGGLPIVSGMPAEVLIKGEERTAFNYLLGPLLTSVRRSFLEQ